MNIRVTICHSIHYEKHQKMAFFRPGAPFVRADGLNLGSKFEYFLTKVEDAFRHQTEVASHTETP